MTTTMSREPLKHPLRLGTRFVDAANGNATTIVRFRNSVYCLQYPSGDHFTLSFSSLDRLWETGCLDAAPPIADLESVPLKQEPPPVEQPKLCAFADEVLIYIEPHSTLVPNYKAALQKARKIVASRYREWPTCGDNTVPLHVHHRAQALDDPHYRIFLQCFLCHDKKYGGVR